MQKLALQLVGFQYCLAVSFPCKLSWFGFFNDLCYKISLKCLWKTQISCINSTIFAHVNIKCPEVFLGLQGVSLLHKTVLVVVLYLCFHSFCSRVLCLTSVWGYLTFSSMSLFLNPVKILPPDLMLSNFFGCHSVLSHVNLCWMESAPSVILLFILLMHHLIWF